jgi:putative endopeptidase
VQSDPMADSERTLPMVLNASYNTQINGFEVTAAIVRPPMFMPEMDAAVNFCRLGAALGHEMTHGFDSGGRQFDAGGAMRDWWTEADAAAFTAEAQKLIEQGNAYEILPGLHTSGELNVKENMADVGGITLAFEALKDYLAEHPGENVEIDGLSPAQRCFISWAQLWTEEMSEQKLRGLVANDFHPPNVYRTTAALQHVDAFYEAFGIEEGDPMWLAPEKRVKAW